jgi:hypothetical protein
MKGDIKSRKSAERDLRYVTFSTHTSHSSLRKARP